jgi:hypothetical protein
MVGGGGGRRFGTKLCSSSIGKMSIYSPDTSDWSWSYSCPSHLLRLLPRRHYTSSSILPLLSTSEASTTTTTTTTTKKPNNNTTASGDKRLAGRPRFYKVVDVKAFPGAPWEQQQQQVGTDDVETTTSLVESPISAGVDGTQSATGVRYIPSNVHNVVKDDGIETAATTTTTTASSPWSMLMPRRPGVDDVGVVMSSTKNNDNNSTTQWYGVTLDGRTLTTPMGQKLSVPSQMLAQMIAAEWDAQTTHLQPSNMPLMTLACTTLDQANYHPDIYRKEILKYLPTDTVRTPNGIHASNITLYIPFNIGYSYDIHIHK